ncbi:hypothetical protein FRB99_006329 [Tulasnella sp. 403]|nr:hypothetical protein FRB99_006329 [Tulasnella sp. 403]
MLGYIVHRQTSRLIVHPRPFYYGLGTLNRGFAASSLRLEPAKKTEEGPKTVKKAPKVKASDEQPKKSRSKASADDAADSKPKVSKRSPSKPKAEKKPKPKEVKPKKPAKLWTAPPKRPSMAFGYYLREHAAKQTEKGRPDFKEVHKAWNALSDAEKRPYYEEKERLAAEYPAKFEAWKANLPQGGYTQYRKHVLKKFRERRVPGAPLNAYMQFAMDIEANHPDKLPPAAEGADKREVVKARKVALGAMWNEMSLGQKAPYVAKYEELRNEYQKKKLAILEAKAKDKSP